MAKLTDLEKVRRQRQRRRMARNLLFLALFGAAVLFCASVVRHVGDLDLKTAYSDIKSEFTTGQGFPVSLPGGKISRLDSLDNNVVLLSDTNLYTYNSTGRQLLNVQHGMVNQSMSASRDRILLYDRGGNKLSLYSKSAKIADLETDYKIYTADLAQNGNYAVATSSREYMAHVVVYNRANKEIFNWFSYQRPVVSLSVSDGKDEMMVGCVDVSGGSYLSSISRFQFSIKQEMGSVEFPDELLLSIDHQGNRLRAYTDKQAVLLSSDLKEQGSYSYGDRKLNRILSPARGLVALVLGDFAEDRALTVVTLGEDFRKLGEFTVPYEIQEIQSDGEHLYLISKDRIEVRNPDGSEAASQQVKGARHLHPSGGKLYYTTYTELGSIEIKPLIEPPAASGKGGEQPSSKPAASSKAVSDEKGGPESGDARGESPEASSAGEEDSGVPEDEKLRAASSPKEPGPMEGDGEGEPRG